MSEQLRQQAKDAAIARILKVEDGKHAGMGIVVGPRYVLTCAHVLNVAVGRPPAATAPEPKGKIAVAFPLSESDAVIEGEVVAWHPMRPRIVADIAVLHLDQDVPEDVGSAIFARVHRPLDNDLLNVFGIVSDNHVGNHVEAAFRGPTTVGQAQIDGTGASAGVSIRGGFSGAAVWDTAYQAFVGMVRAINPDSPEQAAYMVPTPVLQKAWPPLPVEDRRLPPSFNSLWTVFTTLFFAIILAIFLWNRGPWASDEISAFIGMNVYALLAPIVGLMWLRYVEDFKLHGWSSRIPKFGNFRADPGSRAEKHAWGLSVFFLVILPLYAQGHFLKTFHLKGDVFIYADAFDFKREELERLDCPKGSGQRCVCWKHPSRQLCQHPDAGPYSIVTPASPDKGGYWDNYYHYGEKSRENFSVTFFPILQPVVVISLTFVAVILYGRTLWRTFWKATQITAPSIELAKPPPPSTA